jgi:hypothetical protein
MRKDLIGALSLLAPLLLVTHPSIPAAQRHGAPTEVTRDTLQEPSSQESRHDATGHSVARLWDEQLLAAIRKDIPKPPAHARNLFHLSVAMWDAWAAYSPAAIGYLFKEKHDAVDVEAARAEAISYAAYRLLQYRFPVGQFDADGKPCHPGAPISQAAFDTQMDQLGYDKFNTSTTGDSPAALGNHIAEAMIAYGQSDGANEGPGRCYPDDTGYQAQNPELIFKLPGAGQIFDPNRWQPLAFDYFVTQNGIPLGQAIQRFVGVGWGDVKPFALTVADINPLNGLYLDPGPQPKLGGAGDGTVKAAMVQNILFSAQTDPRQDEFIDISPGAPHMANPVGTDDGVGHPFNPATGAPYEPNLVNRGDYVRVVAEFWADGPRSETPPGHWNVLANEVADRLAIKRIGGKGRPVNNLEWDVKTYLALNGAVHDAAIWAWGLKTYYDSSRPITLIRTMGGFGQSSDPSGPSYHPDGLPLVPDLIEPITYETTLPGGKHQHLAGFEGEIAIRSWLGSPPDPHTQLGGVGWIRAKTWMPFQLNTFVTPPFPGYPSGHSTYSRSAAEVLVAITGSEFFPGGLDTFVADANAYLSFEEGPTQTVTLQWATYYDAADQAGISRRFGGIHPFYDDYPGRRTGSKIGKQAWVRAESLFGERMTICHDPWGRALRPITMTVDSSALPTHLHHGDQLGACED